MRKRIQQNALLLTAGIFLAAAPATAAKNLVAGNCAGCHQSDGETIWGTVVPGSQTDHSLKVTTGKDVWNVRYDQQSDLDRFSNARELPDETALSVTFTGAAGDSVHADTMSYKPSYQFHTLDNVITIADVARQLKKSPQEGNYMIVDARGYDNFIEGHLPNAVNIPYYELQDYKDRLPKDKNTRIIAYCRGFT